MTDPNEPTPEGLVNYVREQVTLYPEKFGIMGQYAQEMLDAQVSHDYFYDMMAMRLVTSVMCGRTITDKPQVVLHLPENPWQHVKYKLLGWADRTEQGLWRKVSWKNFWKLAPYGLAVLIWKWTYKRPVKYTKITADVHFEQRVLYPEIDMPANAGRPVIYETLSISYPGEQPPYGSNLASDPSRFLNRHEVMSQMQRDPEFSAESNRYPASPNPYAVLQWLARHGVNVDQLVKRA